MIQCRDCGSYYPADELDLLTGLCYSCAKVYADEEQDWEREEQPNEEGEKE